MTIPLAEIDNKEGSANLSGEMKDLTSVLVVLSLSWHGAQLKKICSPGERTVFGINRQPLHGNKRGSLKDRIN